MRVSVRAERDLAARLTELNNRRETIEMQKPWLTERELDLLRDP
jgi:hypothetical protein